LAASAGPFTGHAAILQLSSLMAQRLDPVTFERSGDAFQVAEGVGSNPLNGTGEGMTASGNMLAHRSGGSGGSVISLGSIAAAREDDTIRILAEEGGTDLRGVSHCFTDDSAAAERALATGFYLSIPGVVSFPKAEALRAALTRVPASSRPTAPTWRRCRTAASATNRPTWPRSLTMSPRPAAWPRSGGRRNRSQLRRLVPSIALGLDADGVSG
jgi:hypothetical protein